MLMTTIEVQKKITRPGISAGGAPRERNLARTAAAVTQRGKFRGYPLRSNREHACLPALIFARMLMPTKWRRHRYQIVPSSGKFFYNYCHFCVSNCYNMVKY